MALLRKSRLAKQLFLTTPYNNRRKNHEPGYQCCNERISAAAGCGFFRRSGRRF